MEAEPQGPAAENPPESAQSALPKFIGDYEVLKFIGRGKFAVVYRAKKIGGGGEPEVALKRISVDMMNEKAREKCLKEVRLLQSLDHPNIIRYMDSFITENDLIIVYEWAAAGDLKRQLRKAAEKGITYEERTIWKYFSQIANAMQHMHEKRIMHRDLKPANIFLTLEGVIKVGDLGLSRELSEHTIQAHSKVGTPLYMSPEVLKSDGYDFKSDIWSLGCLLYELAVLKSPFKADGLNMYTLLHKIANGEYQPLPETFSAELRSLCHSMISTKPEDRPEIGYICQVAAQMRQQTSDRAGRLKRSSSNGSITMQMQQTQAEAAPGIAPGSGAGIGAADADGVAGAKDEPRSRPPSSRPASSTLPVHGLSPAVVMPASDAKGGDMKGLDLDAYFQPPRQGSREGREGRPTHAAGSKDVSGLTPSAVAVATGVTPYDLPSDRPPMYRRAKANSGDNLTLKAVGTGGERPRSKSAPRPISGTDREVEYHSAPSSDRSSALATALENASPAFALMETVHSKLLLAGYDVCNPRRVTMSEYAAEQRTRDCILPIHFAVNLHLFTHVGRLESRHVSKQFVQFADVVRFCGERMRQTEVREGLRTLGADADMPITVAKTILRFLPMVAPMTDELSGITPTNLLPGYGYSVCLVLDAYLSTAIADSHPDTTPIYPRDLDLTNADTAGDGADDDYADGTDEVQEESLDAHHDAASAWGSAADDMPDLSTTFVHAAYPAPSLISPEQWNLETERVAPVLMRKHKETAYDPLAASWRLHVDQLAGYARGTQVRSDADGARPSSRTGFTAGSGVGDVHVVEVLRKLRATVQQELGAISSQERVVNLREAAGRMSAEFAQHQQERDGEAARVVACQTRITASEAALQSVESDLDELLLSLRRRHDDADAGSGSANPVLRIKQAMLALQHEIKVTNLSIHISNSQLLQLRQRQTQLKVRKLVAFKRRRRRGSRDLDESVDTT